jgi:hypothetical protein
MTIINVEPEGKYAERSGRERFSKSMKCKKFSMRIYE